MYDDRHYIIGVVISALLGVALAFGIYATAGNYRAAHCQKVGQISTVGAKTFIPNHLEYMLPMKVGSVTTLIPIFSGDQYYLSLSDGTSLSVTSKQFTATHEGDSVTYERTVCQ